MYNTRFITALNVYFLKMKINFKRYKHGDRKVCGPRLRSSQVCWMVPEAGDKLFRGELSQTNLVDGSEQREVVLKSLGGQNVVHLRQDSD